MAKEKVQITFGGLLSVYIIVFSDIMKALSLYSLDLLLPSSPVYIPSYPGSLKKGSSFNIKACIDTKTCSIVDVFGIHFSFPSPVHVFKRLRQTFPQSYKFGFNRRPPE